MFHTAVPLSTIVNPSLSQTVPPSIRPAACLSASPGKRVRHAVTPAYALCFHASLDSPKAVRLTRISHVYTTERAQVAEGQDSKWPDESVTLGKFHPRVSGGSKMSAGKFVLIALTRRDNA